MINILGGAVIYKNMSGPDGYRRKKEPIQAGGGKGGLVRV